MKRSMISPVGVMPSARLTQHSRKLNQEGTPDNFRANSNHPSLPNCPIESHMATRGAPSTSRIGQDQPEKRSSNQNKFLSALKIPSHASVSTNVSNPPVENAKPVMVPTMSSLPPKNFLEQQNVNVSMPVLGSTRWNISDDEMLIKIRSEVTSKVVWPEIANKMGRETMDVLHRWFCILYPNDRLKGPWSKPEDEYLIAAVNRRNGTKDTIRWCEVANEMPGRTGKQCRERWSNYLDPTINTGEWTEAEDDLLFTKQQEIGNKWCEISSLLPGRTENQVKNRYNSSHKKKWYEKRMRNGNGGSSMPYEPLNGSVPSTIGGTALGGGNSPTSPQTAFPGMPPVMYQQMLLQQLMMLGVQLPKSSDGSLMITPEIQSLLTQMHQQNILASQALREKCNVIPQQQQQQPFPMDLSPQSQLYPSHNSPNSAAGSLSSATSHINGTLESKHSLSPKPSEQTSMASRSPPPSLVTDDDLLMMGSTSPPINSNGSSIYFNNSPTTLPGFTPTNLVSTRNSDLLNEMPLIDPTMQFGPNSLASLRTRGGNTFRSTSSYLNPTPTPSGHKQHNSNDIDEDTDISHKATNKSKNNRHVFDFESIPMPPPPKGFGEGSINLLDNSFDHLSIHEDTDRSQRSLTSLGFGSPSMRPIRMPFVNSGRSPERKKPMPNSYLFDESKHPPRFEEDHIEHKNRNLSQNPSSTGTRSSGVSENRDNGSPHYDESKFSDNNDQRNRNKAKDEDEDDDLAIDPFGFPSFDGSLSPLNSNWN
eukprot:TRINITY_DN2915_c0_g2_i1.p1 TRINITY_DN2915_c0_g2~~TRINITY_DN2915_c0_g2_i1.p1  ORF type:complete len:761 (-),score=196.38 TRINITY_DN2915_c0_g2_i1:578-2860(-)